MDRIVAKRKFPLWRLLGFACLAALGLFFGFQLLVVDKKPVTSPKKASLRISTVREAPFQEFFIVDAFVAPSRSVYIDSEEYGIVQSVNADRGSVVNRGEALLRLRNEELESQLASKRTELEGLAVELAASATRKERTRVAHREAALELDHALESMAEDLEVKEKLWSEGCLPDLELRKARRELEFLERKKELLEASQALELESIDRESARISSSMELARIDAGRLESRRRALTVVSPAYGQIAQFDASVGETENIGSRIARIDILDPMKLKATLDEYYLSRIDLGSTATFRYPDRKGDDADFPARASWIASDVQRNSFEAEFEFVGPPPAVKVGQRLALRVAQGAPRRCLVVEQGPFFRGTGGSWIFVLDPGGRSAARRTISAGRSNPDELEVVSGLKAGEKVIVSDYSGFGDAQRIDLK